jgi:hypothetical protein
MFLRAAHANKPANTPAHGGPAKSIAPPIVHRVLDSPGRPLDAATRAFVEPRFGHDFSQVRIHDDQRAMESVHAVNALAYTVGPHIAFANEFQPSHPAGMRTLAHELAHVIQQGGISAAANEKIEIGRTDDRSETEADEFASSVMNQTPHRALNRNSLRLARQTQQTPTPAPAPAAAPASPQQALMNDALAGRLAYLQRSRFRLRQLQIACEEGAAPLAITQIMPEEVRPFVAWLGVLPTDSYFCAVVNWMKALVQEAIDTTVPPFFFAGPTDEVCLYRNEFAYAIYEADLNRIRVCPKTVDPARTNSTTRTLVLIHEIFHDPKFRMEHPTPETQNTSHCGSMGVLEAMINPYCVTNVIGSLGGGSGAVF